MFSDTFKTTHICLVMLYAERIMSLSSGSDRRHSAQNLPQHYFNIAALKVFYIYYPFLCTCLTLHHKNNKSHGTGDLGSVHSQCIIYTTYIKGRFRSAKCLNNSSHANKKRSERSKGWVGGGRGLASDPESQTWWWCCIFSPHYSRLAHCRANHHYMQRDAWRVWGGKKEK